MKPGLSERIKTKALALGFDLAGITRVEESEHAHMYRAWLAAGHHGEMSYLARQDAVERRLHPETTLSVLSAIVVGINYYTGDEPVDASHGIIARYTHGRDYHKVIKNKLLVLLEWIEQEIGYDLPLARACVDTAAVFERELAQRAGLGWHARNTMLINPRVGSFFFLGALLLEIEVDEYDAPFEKDHCGSCNACVDACPTNALLGRDENGAPVMDARRCISYLTIELRGPIPSDLRPLIGNRIFGCDICQEVCPWNSDKFVQLTRERDFSPRADLRGPALVKLMRMTETEWDTYSRGSAIRRAKRAGFLRNVAVALGNWGSEEAVEPLADALNDQEPIVRGHAAWALGRIGGEVATDALRAALALECDETVRQELMAALRLRNTSCND